MAGVESVGSVLISVFTIVGLTSGPAAVMVGAAVDVGAVVVGGAVSVGGAVAVSFDKKARGFVIGSVSGPAASGVGVSETGICIKK